MTNDGVAAAWQELPPDDPFVQQFAEPSEVVHDGINVVDWDSRKMPGRSREASERLLVVTSKRVILIRKVGGGMSEMRYDDIEAISDRKMGMQGFVAIEGNNGADVTFSMHRNVAPVVAERMRAYWNRRASNRRTT